MRFTTLHPPRVLGALTAIVGFALSVFAFWPGIFTVDSMNQFAQARTGAFEDWHPPAMAALWFLLERLHDGPELLFLVHLALFWIGAWAVSDGLVRSGLKLSGLFPLIGLLPFVFNYLGLLWKDVAVASAWIFAAGLVFRRRAAGEKLSAVEHGAIWFAFLYGALARANTIFAAAPLALYLIDIDLYSKRLWPQLAACVIVPLSLLTASSVFNTAIHAEKEYPSSSLILFDLVAISHRENINLVPGVWDAEQTQIIPTCYGADKWDHITVGRCDFITDTLDDRHLLGSPALTHAWISAVLAHPGDYLAHRLAFTNQILRWRGPIPVHDSFMETEIPDPTLQNHANMVSRFYESICNALDTTPLFRPYFWLIAALGALALAWFAEPSPQRMFAAALSASAAIYLLTYIPFGVASDFRYAYWSIIATLAAGAALCACAWRTPRRLFVTAAVSAGVTVLAIAVSMLS